MTHHRHAGHRQSTAGRVPVAALPLAPHNGFTLVELLAVMTVILILAAMVLGTAKFATEKSKRAKAEADMRKLSDVAEMSYAHYGEYTKTPFTAALATDPWGMPYLYSNYCVTGPGFTQFQAYAFYSFGPDMAPGDKRNPLSQLGDGDDMVVGNYGRKWGRVKE